MSDVKLKRNTFIGGSDVAAILGINRYKTAYEVWDEKKNGNTTFEGNPATEWGKKLEPIIVDHFANQHSVMVVSRNDKFISSIPYLGCHPDGITVSAKQSLVEAKTVSSNAFKFWSNEIPLEYYCQIQHNLFCCNLEHAYFICLVLDDRNYFEIEINRDNDFIEKQNIFLINWWNKYIIGNEVPIKVVADYEKENPDFTIVDADDETIKIYDEYKVVKGNFEKLKEEKELLEDKLKEKIGSATDLYSGINLLATWRSYTQVRVDSKKLKEESPEVFLKYCKEISGRKFLTKT